MNPLVKKEIRLLRPSWTAAVLLALVQGITRPYDFYVASLLFFGLTIMALSTIGRETSLNTFSSLVALPAERIRIWQTKLSVLAGAFLIVFAVWLTAFGIACLHSDLDASDHQNSYNLFITVCLIASATFTGGLWTTLLLRQLAGAFWITLLVPATLAGFSGIFLAGSGVSDHLVIAVLSVVIGVYSVAGFLFARWLFFHAQDVGWSGGVIALPEWKFLSARSIGAVEVRKRQPIVALLKKELLLQQGVLTGAVGLLVLHVVILGLRVVHQFPKDSVGEGVGEILTSIVWMLWLVLPVLLGSSAVAEERKFGVMESQLCLPASRRVQFAAKVFMTLGLGVFLGGVMPMLLESIGEAVGSRNPMFTSDNHQFDQSQLGWFLCGTMAFSAWTVLVGLFASSLARSFLQAFGIALVTFVGLMMCIPAFTSERMIFFASIAPRSLLPLFVAVPTLIITLAWLTWLNFRNFRDGWPLWRRQLLGAVGAFVFIVAGSAAIYHRAWEVLEPAEPAHGPAQFSLANPPVIHHNDEADNLLVRLPDGRIWFDRLGFAPSPGGLRYVLQRSLDPFPGSTGPQQFVAGSNWISAVVQDYGHGLSSITNWDQVDLEKIPQQNGRPFQADVRKDGTLWCSLSHRHTNPSAKAKVETYQVGTETNWVSAASLWTGALVALKSDGTLWQRGLNDQTSWAITNPPTRLGIHHDWVALAAVQNDVVSLAADGSLWLWPNREIMSYQQPVLKLPKQPKFLGNIFTESTSRQPEGLKTEVHGKFLAAGDILRNTNECSR